jgi:hypothetical protein
MKDGNEHMIFRAPESKFSLAKMREIKPKETSRKYKKKRRKSARDT